MIKNESIAFPRGEGRSHSMRKTALNRRSPQLASAMPQIIVNSMCLGWCHTEMGDRSSHTERQTPIRHAHEPPKI